MKKIFIILFIIFFTFINAYSQDTIITKMSNPIYAKVTDIGLNELNI